MLTGQVLWQSVLKRPHAERLDFEILAGKLGTGEIPSTGVLSVDRSALLGSTRLAMFIPDTLELSAVSLSEALLADLSAAFFHVADVYLKEAVVVRVEGKAQGDNAATWVGGDNLAAEIVTTATQVVSSIDLIATDTRPPDKILLHGLERGPAASASRSALGRRTGSRLRMLHAGREVREDIERRPLVDQARDVIVALAETASLVWCVHHAMCVRRRMQN